MFRRMLLGLAMVSAVSLPALAADPIVIRIGHQSMCTDTYPAGLVMKGLNLLQKYLPHTGKYAGATYDVEWSDYSSGSPITQMMMAKKLDFGVMGDYPLVVNGARFQATARERSYLIAMTNYNLTGAGNGIVVPVDSPAKSIKDLEGKTLSVPIGSAAWGMLFKMSQDEDIPLDKFHIVNQDPMVGIASIATHKIDAHADFCPMSEYMEYNGTGRMIYSGASTDIPYLHGVVVTKAFADKYPEIVVAYIKAVIDAQKWINADPKRAATMMAQWTMIPKEVFYLYFSHGGYLHADPTLKTKWLDTLAFDHGILAKYAHIPPLDMKSWVKPQYIETAYKELGMDYAKALAAPPHDPKADINRPAQLWIAGKGITDFPTNDALLAAMRQAAEAKETVNAGYVYDHDIGLKLFAQYAYYVAEPGQPTYAFITEGAANRYAGGKGKVMDFAAALAAPSLVAELTKHQMMPMRMGSDIKTGNAQMNGMKMDGMKMDGMKMSGMPNKSN